MILMGISLNQGLPSVFGIVLSSKRLHNISACISENINFGQILEQL